MGIVEKHSSYRWLVLLAGCLAICTIYMDMIAYAPILGEIAKKLTIEMGAATNLMMGFVLSVACVLIWGGVVCDKFGITTALVLGLLCSTLPTAIIPWIGGNYAAVMMARLVQGASVGFVFATIGPILALWFHPREHGMASGLLIGSISLGCAIGVFASPAVLGMTGSWEKTIFTLGIPGWAAILLAIIATRKNPPQISTEEAISSSDTPPTSMSFMDALACPITWLGSLIVFCNAWAMYGLYNLVPPYLAADAPMGLGLGAAMSGKLSIAVTIIGLFATIFGGLFFDKVAKGNSRLAAIIGFLISACVIVILLPAVSKSITVLALCLLVVGWGIPFMGPSISAFIAMNYPPGIVGRMIGWWFGFGTFGGAAGLYLGGMSISKSGNFYLAISMISIASMIGVLLSLFLKRTLKPTAA
ncbi:membrane protein, major facilitator superfamily [Geotalea daltonii FRC-32]|uniref:Membrane protein, major facilitator superfamily n=1 Tax=Geotalea daltonii (strain DSM 22248 / JCM 15807 / FRC-32) TaxID=316067 RepID=B9M8G6_GEODF|nr:MFS transporter [Geotalea daltonii]ACM18501.1 membrane protein, major facilitator superfamily [Geotalea daltonii FRC-32]